MLADNLTLFGSQMNDIQEMRGFDPNMSLAMDQSINVENMGDLNQNAPFNADESVVANYRSAS